MEDRSIVNSQITASSYHSGFLDTYHPHKARLNSDDYWETATENPSNPWIQIDFLDSVELHGIQTQGITNPFYNEWVSELQVQTGDSDNSLVFIEDGDGNQMVMYCHFVDTRYAQQKLGLKLDMV